MTYGRLREFRRASRTSNLCGLGCEEEGSGGSRHYLTEASEHSKSSTCQSSANLKLKVFKFIIEICFYDRAHVSGVFFTAGQFVGRGWGGGNHQGSNDEVIEIIQMSIGPSFHLVLERWQSAFFFFLLSILSGLCITVIRCRAVRHGGGGGGGLDGPKAKTRNKLHETVSSWIAHIPNPAPPSFQPQISFNGRQMYSSCVLGLCPKAR